MRRVAVLTILLILSFLLQTTVFSLHDLTGPAPNLTLILTMSFGIMRGRKEGLLTGFFSGLLYDLFFGSYLGIYAFVYMKKYLMEDISLPVLIIIVDQLVLDMITFIGNFLLRNRVNLGYMFVHHMLPQLLYDVLLTVLVYRIYLRINRHLRRKAAES